MARGAAGHRHGLAVSRRPVATATGARTQHRGVPRRRPSRSVPFVLAAAVHLAFSILQSLAWGSVAVFIVVAATLILTLAG